MPGFFLFLEAVLQRNAAVEHQVLSAAVAVIQAEVAHAHELERGGVDTGAVGLLVELGSHSGHSLFHLTAGEDLQRIGIQAVQEVLVCTIGSGIGEQVIVETNLCVQCGLCINPVDGSTLDLAAVSRVAALAFCRGRNIITLALVDGEC